MNNKDFLIERVHRLESLLKRIRDELNYINMFERADIQTQQKNSALDEIHSILEEYGF